MVGYIAVLIWFTIAYLIAGLIASWAAEQILLTNIIKQNNIPPGQTDAYVQTFGRVKRWFFSRHDRRYNEMLNPTHISMSYLASPGIVILIWVVALLLSLVRNFSAFYLINTLFWLALTAKNLFDVYQSPAKLLATEIPTE